MEPTKDIHAIWQKFDGFPMENLTKAWYYYQTCGKKQRSVAQMKKNRKEYGCSGNCFDLAIWLLAECKQDGVEAYAVGHDLFTEDAHVAVVAKNHKGYQFLCDLGDQWIKPILVDDRSTEFCEDYQAGFFPAAEVKVELMEEEKKCRITYLRSNGKRSRQDYSLEQIEEKKLREAAEHSQNLLSDPLCEMRIPLGDEIAHWEFDDFSSFIGTSKRLDKEYKLDSIEEWAARISKRSGICEEVIKVSLENYLKK